VAKLVNTQTNAIGEVDDDDLYDYLDSGIYEFASDETPIHVADPEDWEGLGQASYMNRLDAKRYILQRAGTYMSDDRLNEFRNKRDYGDSEVAAAALGASGALTFGLAPAFAGLVSDKAAGIMEANPNWMLGSDIMTTIAALALAPATSGASAAAGSGAALRLLAKTPLGKKGAESLLRNAGAIGRHTAPHLANKFGKGVQGKIGRKLLGEAAEDQLKKAGMRGLTARMGGMGAEALLYSAGYSLHDVVKDFKKDREWDEIASSYAQNVGVGTLIGLAIPGVFMGTPMLAGKTLSSAKKFAAMPVNWAFDSKFADDVLDMIAKGHDDMYIESKFGEAADKINIKQMITSLRNRSGAHKEAKEYSKTIPRLVGQVTSMLDRSTKLSEFMGKMRQKPHNKAIIKSSILAGGEGRMDSASSLLLANNLVVGNKALQNEQVSGGFLYDLMDRTKVLLASGRKGFTSERFNPKTNMVEEVYEKISAQGEQELKGVLSDVEGLIGLVDGYAKRHIGTIDAVTRKVNASRSASEGFKRYLSRHADSNLPNWTDTQKIIASAMPDDSMRKSIKRSVDFNTEVFFRLENLSARIHRTMPEGALQEGLHNETWRTGLKDLITDFLTESGKVWSPNSNQTMFGRMSKYKKNFNALLVARTGQEETLVKNFFVPLEKFPSKKRVERARVEATLRTLHRADAESLLKHLDEYADNNVKILRWIKKNINYTTASEDLMGEGPMDIIASLDEASLIKKTLETLRNKLDGGMRKTLEWSAVLNSEAKQAQALPNRGIMPYLGTGALASAAGYAVGGPVGAAAAGAATLGSRYAYDAMANPSKALASMQKFFAASDAFDSLIEKQVERYMTWVNTAGKSKAGRLQYNGPGSDSSGRYSRVLSSRFIADYVSGGEE